MTDRKSPMMKHKHPDEQGFNVIWFEWDSERNNSASEAHGRPIYDDILWVYIQSPGAKNQIASHVIERRREGGEVIHYEVRERFHEQLKSWEAGNAEGHAGTPLDELHILDRSQIATLKEVGIHNIEALSSVSDQTLPEIGIGGRVMRDAAKGYLDKAAGLEPVTRMAAENEELRSMIAHLTAQVDALTAPAKDDDESGRKSRKAA